MQKFEGEQEFTFQLNYLEACYLNAAIVEFFHKMRSAVELENPTPIYDDRYNVSKSLWDKIEQQIPIMEWE